MMPSEGMVMAGLSLDSAEAAWKWDDPGDWGLWGAPAGEGAVGTYQ